MFYRVTNAIKKIFIQEIQDILKDHPEFHDTLVINKYQDQEREKNNIIVKSSSVSSFKLSMNNFITTYQSYSVLANLKEQRGNMLEWIKDDINNIDNLIRPAFYVIRMISQTQFTIEQYFIIHNEPLENWVQDQYGNLITNLKHNDINPGSDVVLDDRGIRFIRDIHYNINYDTGAIKFLTSTNGIGVYINYQYIKPTLGPFDVNQYHINNTVLPGLILAFGDQIREGDLQLIVISEYSEYATEVYGGRWTTNLDLEIRAQDTDAMERLSDFVATMIWAKKQINLVDRGITITDLSLAGESEEPELDVPDEYSFTNTLTMSLNVDWEIHLPLLQTIENIYFNPSIYTQLYNSKQVYEYEQAKKTSIDPRTFGTQSEGLQQYGRHNEDTLGSGHFGGLIPVSMVTSPN